MRLIGQLAVICWWREIPCLALRPATGHSELDIWTGHTLFVGSLDTLHLRTFCCRVTSWSKVLCIPAMPPKRATRASRNTPKSPQPQQPVRPAQGTPAPQQAGQDGEHVPAKKKPTTADNARAIHAMQAEMSTMTGLLSHLTQRLCPEPPPSVPEQPPSIIPEANPENYAPRGRATERHADPYRAWSAPRPSSPYRDRHPSAPKPSSPRQWPQPTIPLMRACSALLHHGTSVTLIHSLPARVLDPTETSRRLFSAWRTTLTFPPELRPCSLPG